MRSLPSRLARYRLASASSMSSSSVRSSSPPPTATPTLTVVRIRTLPCQTERPETAADPFGNDESVGCGQAPQQRANLVASVPSQEIAPANVICNASSNGLEYGIAGSMAELVVDRLELVQIEEQNGQALTPLLAPGHRSRSGGAPQRAPTDGSPGPRATAMFDPQTKLGRQWRDELSPRGSRRRSGSQHTIRRGRAPEAVRR